MDIEDNVSESIQIDNTLDRINDNFVADEVSTTIEALLFASTAPLSAVQIARIVKRDKREVIAIIDDLNVRYAQWGRSFRIERFEENFRLYTLPEYDKFISHLADIPRPAKLSRAALEVLSIIAYRQPVIKSEIEKIRGIDSDGVIRTLLERGMITISGRSDGPGRPWLYRTTSEFLEFFGIASLADLPSPEVVAQEMEIPRTLAIVRSPEPTGDDEL